MSSYRSRAKRAMMQGLESSDSYSSSEYDDTVENFGKTSSEISEMMSEEPAETFSVVEPAPNAVRKLLALWDELYPTLAGK